MTQLVSGSETIRIQEGQDDKITEKKKFHRLDVLTRRLETSGPWKSKVPFGGKKRDILLFTVFVFYSYFSTANYLFILVKDPE
jgi:hypothetical protein